MSIHSGTAQNALVRYTLTRQSVLHTLTGSESRGVVACLYRELDMALASGIDTSIKRFLMTAIYTEKQNGRRFHAREQLVSIV